MLRKPNDIAGVAAADFLQQIGGQLVQLFFEEAAVAVGGFRVAAADEVPDPEHKDQQAHARKTAAAPAGGGPMGVDTGAAGSYRAGAEVFRG